MDTRIEAVMNMAVPETKGQLRSFTGLVNYFRESVPKLGLLMAPLHAVGATARVAFHRKLGETSRNRLSNSARKLLVKLALCIGSTPLSLSRCGRMPVISELVRCCSR